jgi:hypothetical protein
MEVRNRLSELPNGELVAEVKRLAERERSVTACLIASLAELDARRLYLDEGCSSLFTYCTQVLHLSEHAAYGRIEAARAARRFPAILDRLADGSLTLTAVGLLARHITAANHRAVIDAARHRTRREVEHLVATLAPRPPVPSSVRKLPESRSAQPAGSSAEARVTVEEAPRPATSDPARARQRPVVQPVASERYRVQLTVTADTHAKLRRAQDLLRHVVPNGDPAVIFDRALTLLVQQLERQKLGAARRPRDQASDRGDAASELAIRSARGRRTRHVPAAVRRAVWARDNGQCAFVGVNGRCTERSFLEFHHVVPHADAGAATADNVQVRCRAHNQYEADVWFGAGIVRERRGRYSVQTEFEGVAECDLSCHAPWLYSG